MRTKILGIVFTISTFSATAATIIIPTNSMWEQSFDSLNWTQAEVQLADPFADWIWPAAAVSNERAYFRRSFELSEMPTYSAFHYFFRGDGEVWLNGTRIVNDHDLFSTSGGVVTTFASLAGFNQLLVTVAPTGGSGFPGTFTGYFEVESAALVPEPSTVLLFVLGLIALTASSRRVKKT